MNVTIGGNNVVLDGGTLQFISAATFGPANTFQLTGNNGTVDTQGFNDTISSAIIRHKVPFTTAARV